MSPRDAASEEAVRAAAARALGLKPSAVADLCVVRRSIDARRAPVVCVLGVRIATDEGESAAPRPYSPDYCMVDADSPRVIIVGAGPAGLFAALRALEYRIRPIVLERGKGVDERRLDLAQIKRTDAVDPESNYCFGEGGAGAFSDGKLFTRSKKRGNVDEILQVLCAHGASETILRDAHPHIGSDRLPGVIRNIRHRIIDCGGEVHFGARVDEILIEDSRAVGVRLSDGEEIHGPVVLATGHSARDVYRMLHSLGVRIEAKGLAMGVRLEHPQELIDRQQYHSPQGRGRWLPPAEYNYVVQSGGRGVYSFCMCPGGVIVPAASGPDQLVVNGMSASHRAGRWANSGMVVELHPGDFPEYDDAGPLCMLELQEDMEKKFYEASGRTLRAPAQRMVDFVEGHESADLPASSYAPGLVAARIDELLPPFIASRLRDGFVRMGRKSPDFLTNKAALIGLESRTSSPVRIPRDKLTLEHPEVEALYPAGEGAGQAGGIVSAAIDGRRCIDALAASMGLNKEN